MNDQTLFGKIAAVAHEANRVFTNVFCDYAAFSPKWEDCTEEVKNSAINGIEYILENMPTSSRDSHENWVKFKKENGWKFGKRFNAEKKEHPNLVGYGDLSTEEKVKDYLFKSIVLGLAEAYGLIGAKAVSFELPNEPTPEEVRIGEDQDNIDSGALLDSVKIFGDGFSSDDVETPAPSEDAPTAIPPLDNSGTMKIPEKKPMTMLEAHAVPAEVLPKGDIPDEEPKKSTKKSK
jgi:hypothetical protein